MTGLELKPLAPGLAGDYMDYFRRDAFADHPEWAGCCCLHFHWNSELEAAHEAFTQTAREGNLSFSWRYAERYVREGVIQGYLAYMEGRVVGWCNANDKAAFAALEENVAPELWEAPGAARVKSIVCFSVAPAWRGKGIANALLARVCADAAAQGYDYLEAYARVGSRDVYVNHHGSQTLYTRHGFTLHRSQGGQAVYRRYLHGPTG